LYRTKVGTVLVKVLKCCVCNGNGSLCTFLGQYIQVGESVDSPLTGNCPATVELAAIRDPDARIESAAIMLSASVLLVNATVTSTTSVDPFPMTDPAVMVEASFRRLVSFVLVVFESSITMVPPSTVPAPISVPPWRMEPLAMTLLPVVELVD